MLWCCHDLCCLIYSTHTHNPQVKAPEAFNSSKENEGESGILGRWFNIASPFESLATLVKCVTALSHCRGSSLHLLCTGVSHCTRQSIRCLALGIRAGTVGTLDIVLGWHSLETSNDIKTQHGCSDTSCVSQRFVDEI